jgi:hypothetical protein
MLRKEAISSQLLEVLTILMEMKTLKPFRLVGGHFLGPSNWSSNLVEEFGNKLT